MTGPPTNPTRRPPGRPLADILGIAQDDLDQLIATVPSRYAVFYLIGPTKARRIEAPQPPLRDLQRRLLDDLLYRLHPTDCAHGFVPGRSILTHASLHTGRQWVLKADLANFFPSVSQEMVQRALRPLRLSSADRARVVSLVTLRGRLPQGAPTSPHLANLVTRDLDAHLAGLANRAGWRYSRYADDLAFSGEGQARPILDALGDLVRQAGFRLHPGKTRLMGQGVRQLVTGLVVNDHVAVPRPLRRRLRAMLHRVARSGWDALEGPSPEELLGHLAYYGFIMPDDCRRLLERLAQDT